ncbi:beta-lactamase/transpeptidase-like protein [Aspergillus pseudoustus]|uniref:Beta-lactamase/transpeptidase-like protein n=1 Tax=Aspergillus pseudoustus TaxID=1810923 RepID=A0ABR4L213_9EURO
MKLGDFILKNICRPLGLESTTKQPELLPHFEEKRVDIGIRNDDGAFSTVPEIFPIPTPDDFGGASLYSTPREFTRFLSVLLGGGRGILGQESTDEIFRPQLAPLVREQLNAQVNTAQPMKWMFTTGNVVNFGLGVAITAEDVPGGRSAGSVAWGGHTNTHWWIDRKNGVCATSFFHHLPPCDPGVVSIRDEFEERLYEYLKEATG